MFEVESKSKRIHRSRFARIRRKVKKKIVFDCLVRRYARNRKLRRNK